MSKTELNELAKSFEIESPSKLKKDELIPAILEAQAAKSGLEMANGVLDVLPEGYGFLRRDGYLQGNADIYISQSQIRRFELRRGDLVAGQVRRPKDNEKYYGIVKVETVNGIDPEVLRGRPALEALTPIYPAERFRLATTGGSVAMRLVDLFAPIGRGQRALIVAPPKTGKTTLLKGIAASIAANHPDVHVIALLVDERPEDGTDVMRTIDGEVIVSSFDELPENHVALAELVLERAKRLAELGKDIVVVLDSLTRLARAYAQLPGGRGAGVDPVALHKTKRYFGAARKFEEGGSLTIVAAAHVETGSKIDEAIYDEVRGAANMELVLSRRLAESRVFPAIDVKRSGTRHEEALLSEIELRKVWALRRQLAERDGSEMTELILEQMAGSADNDAFLRSLTS